jgi:glycosyltransferase involved in cell wall biosynthesis
MRIVEIAPSVNPRGGGQEQLVQELVHELTKLGHEVTLIICDKDADVKVPCDLRYVTALKVLGLPWIPSLKGLIKYLRARFDVCHIHYLALFGEIAAVACKICKIPIVTTFWAEGKRRNYMAVYDRVTVHLISQLSDGLICLSEGQKNALARRGLERRKIRVIPTAIYVRALERANVQRVIRDNYNYDLLFVGRLEERKGLQYLLRALAILRQKGFKPRLKVIGDGDYRNRLLALVDDNFLSSQVTFAGYIPREKIFESYVEAKCVVIPSVYEGLPRVALEAMAFGKPIITTSIPGLEIISNRKLGIVVPPKDSESLANAVLEVLSLSPDELRKIELVGKETVKSYDWSNVVNEIVSVYNECTS